jgi:HD domain-containing protein
VTAFALESALTASPMRPLPGPAAELLRALAAPARLGAHLRVVHDVAWTLTDVLGRRRPEVDFDTTAVLFGAATHDIGKVVHRSELAGPGSAHEAAGEELLLRYGVPAHLARFAASHGSWAAPDATLDDLLVSLADQISKGSRVPGLEHRVTGFTGHLTDVLDLLAADAPNRVAFQLSYPL